MVSAELPRRSAQLAVLAAAAIVAGELHGLLVAGLLILRVKGLQSETRSQSGNFAKGEKNFLCEIPIGFPIHNLGIEVSLFSSNSLILLVGAG